MQTSASGEFLPCLTVPREFISGVHRDSYTSHIGHFSRLSYMAVAENESIAKTRFKMLEVSWPLNYWVENDPAVRTAPNEEGGRVIF